jgi:hypothetical protein
MMNGLIKEEEEEEEEEDILIGTLTKRNTHVLINK